MRAVSMVARSEMGRRWRSVVLLIVLVGFVGAVVLASIAGARRSDRALPRFDAASRSATLELLPPLGVTPTPAQVGALRQVRNVSGVAGLRFYAMSLRRKPSSQPGAALDRKFGNVVDRARLIAGRLADPSAPNEIAISEGLAAELHVGVGGHLDAVSYALAQFAKGLNGGDPGPPTGPKLRLRIVGIVRRPLDLSDLGAAGGIIPLTPAFNRVYSGRIGSYGVLYEIRTRNGTADEPAVVAAARRIFGRSGKLSVNSSSAGTEGARSAIDVLTQALWIFAAVAALAGAVAIATVLTREVSFVSADQATLHALGLTRTQRVALSAPAALLVAGGGALLAVLGAVAASPLFPFGIARQADPEIGVHADWLVLAFGIVAVATVVLGIAVMAALRSTRQSSLEIVPTPQRRRSALVELAADAGAPPTATNGVRMALQAGRGETAIPVRSALLGAMFGVLGVVAVLMFSSSLNHLVSTPRLYGWNWDFKVEDQGFNAVGPKRCQRKDDRVARQPGVAAVAAVCYDDIQIDGHAVTGWGFTPVRGTIEPEIVSGRTPRNSREVALGSVTLSTLHKSIGDVVHGRSPNNTTVDYRIVGRIVLPRLGQPQALADGAAFTGAGLSRVLDTNSSAGRYLLGRFASGANRTAVEHQIAAIPRLGNPTGPEVAVEVDRLRRINWFPATLAALLGGLALLAVGHALITAVRRRRRDLALLKTIGFTRLQVRATIAWQATTLAFVGLVVGIPVGIIVGRLVWHRVADGLGVPTAATLPTLAMLLAVPAVLALVNLLAFFPARAAANTRPAVALHSK